MNTSNPFDDDDFVSPTAAPVTASRIAAADDDDWSTPAAAPVSAPAPAGLVSEEAKAAAREAAQKGKAIAQARAKQAGQAASVAAAGLRNKLIELRGQSVGKACKQVCAGIAVVAVLACGGIEWHAHRSISSPEAAAVPVKVAPVAVVQAPAPVVQPAPMQKVEPVAKAPVVVAPAQAPAVAPSTPAAVVAQPVVKAPTVASTRPRLKPKSFNPMSPDYKPEKSKWEIEQEQKLDSYFKPKGH